MKHLRNWMLLFLLTGVVISCSKDHYSLKNLKEAKIEGEVLLPLASASYSVMELLTSFRVDSLLDCDPSGNILYRYQFDQKDVIKGSDFLKYNDMDIEEHFSFTSPYPFVLPVPIDTVVTYHQSIDLESDYVSVKSATMRSGSLCFRFNSNIPTLRRVAIRSSQIKDEQGNDLEIVYHQSWMDSLYIDLTGMSYESQEMDKLDFDLDFYFSLQGTINEVNLDVNLKTRDFRVANMSGRVKTYESRNTIDTLFGLFFDNLSGTFEIKGARIQLRERNSFALPASLTIDTAQLMGPEFEPYSVITPLPLVVEIPPTTTYNVVFNKTVDGKLDSHSGDLYVSSNFIINPDGLENIVTVADTSTIDVNANVEIPFSFRADAVRYTDTIKWDLTEIESQNVVESLTIQITINSTLPFDLAGSFMTYDSINECVTDVLGENLTIIEASYDGQIHKSTIALTVDEERMENILKSDHIILCFDLDTRSHDVVLNANQTLQFYLQASAKYNGVVDLKND